LDNEIHREQATAYLIEPLKKWLSAHGRSAFVGGNSFVYDDPHLKKKALSPDFYVVNGGRQRRQGKWVTWEEQNLLPTLVVEMLSPKTEKSDRTSKFDATATDTAVRTTSCSSPKRKPSKASIWSAVPTWW